MNHQMRLHQEPFSKIKSGTKKIEIRLFDEKRQLLKVGDSVTFTMIDNALETFTAKVVDLVRFSSFRELCESYEPSLYGSESSSEYEPMYNYYSKEEEEKFGVLAIHLELV